MEENHLTPLVHARITDIRFTIATHDEICISSISEAPINHASQLTNPFLGLPLETGKCESCGTAEPGKCEGHFGYIQLPIPVYHPSHVSELKKILTLVCLKCLRLKRGKNVGNDKPSSAPCLYCPDIPRINVNENKTTDGVVLLELKLVTRSDPHNGFWNFLDKYSYRYGEGRSRILLPCEVLEILKKIPEETKRKLSGKGYFPQDGYILQKVPVPPNCLSIPDISDGVSIMSTDISVSMLRKVIKQADIIKSSRSGRPNFESHKAEVNDLQSTVAQYFRARGTAKDTRDIKMRAGNNKEADKSATKAWLEKMRTFFISKGSGYCSRGVITGDAYKGVNEIGLPLEVAQRITFEEKVNECNKDHLQQLVDNKLCLTFRDGGSMYSLREGSKGHTVLRVGQVVHRRIMDGDILFINRPPSTHKHSLQALSVYIHEDHTVKINPLICGPLDADFDGDCVHLFYPQSLAARAEVLELFSVEKQMLSSHSGSLNLQLKNDSLLSLKLMFKRFFLSKANAQQLAMFISSCLAQPALLKANSSESQWTVLQILQTALPDRFDCLGERYLISQSEILKLDLNRDILQSMFNDIISSVFFEKGSKVALNIFNSLQPLLMESIFLEGYSVNLKDYSIPKSILEDLPNIIQGISPLLHHLRSTYNELVELQVGNHLRSVKAPVTNFILKSSGLGNLIDSKSDSAISKVVEQIGFLGLQLFDRGKFYSKNLVEDMTSLFLRKYAVAGLEHPSEAFGLIKSCFFHGLNPYEDLVHSISAREVLVRSSRGLTEPGTLFKSLMTILRDVVICYDGTVRNVCSNSIIQFEYGVDAELNSYRFYPPGEPVGALAATAISNPSYKAVLDSSSSSNASWELMKEVLVCKINFVNDHNDRRVLLYLNECGCSKMYCKENAAYLVRNHLKKVSLKDIALEFLIEYQNQESSPHSPGTDSSLVGHIHLDKTLLKDLDRSMHEVLLKCQETISIFRRKKKNRLADSLKNIFLSVSDCCSSQQSHDIGWCQIPCVQFSLRLDTSGPSLELTSQIMANMICPILLDTIIRGDPRVCTANIIWISPDTTTWVKNHRRTQHGELALEIVLEKSYVKHHGDAWRLALDSCLPVIHLIDTRRSIPYAIRQVQELLGISCAFDQAVQRLSASIRMVNKGVLKEHLILAANSMTCTGSLIGFNKGGYKALFHSLNVQIPFTEATLFTPRKCFERAAEKCHTDALSGIVASCSWGKHVSVGSGTRFEILWNSNEMGSNHNGAIDIYNFLQLVRTGSDGGQLNTSCLGEEYDGIQIEDREAEMSFSPEQNSKLTFDDSDLQNNFEPVDAWGEASKGSPKSAAWNAVESQKQPAQKEHDDAWGSQIIESTSVWNSPKKQPSLKGHDDAWGSQTTESTASGWTTIQKQPVDAWGERSKGSPKSPAWNTIESQKQPPQKGNDAALGSQTAESTRSGGNAMQKQPIKAWGEPSNRSPKSVAWSKIESQKQPLQKGHDDAWGSQTTECTTSDWNATQKQPVDTWGRQTTESTTSGWNATQKQHIDAWGEHSKGPPQSAAWNTAESQKQPQQKGHDAAWGSKTTESTASGWNATQKQPPQKHDNAWGSQTTESTTSGWNATQKQPIDAWGEPSKGSPKSAAWNTIESQKQPPQKGHADAWGSKTTESTASGWNATQKQPQKHDNAWGSQTTESATSGWNTTQNQPIDAWGERSKGSPKSASWNTIESQKQPPQKGHDDAWGSKTTESTNSTQKQPPQKHDNVWGSQTTVSTTSSWNATQKQPSLDGRRDGWGNGAESPWDPSGNSNVNPKQPSFASPRSGVLNITESDEISQEPCDWGSPKTSGWNRDGHNQRDQEKNLPWGRGKRASGRGWGPSNSGGWKQKSRPGTPGKFDDQTPRGNLKIEYTSEEKTILSEVEPVMQSIRRIIHQNGYNDGDPLSTDDQSYVLDNVFNFHPDKAVKMGVGIDYVMINKHGNFQETRCFYVVSTDGRKEDFSYRKCMENFIKEKYPELAASFNAKYFSWKPHRGPEQEQAASSQQ